ncbi:unnamed protein product [Strongylus vulgaris]|uniref:Uncharacterized protein n=1 Tax=Strongylus vulgaris TaxID=40348 RepID=A0A3P7IYJ8_STRVU|nr:unnamed protein product [Strongylus vulgaris]
MIRELSYILLAPAFIAISLTSGNKEIPKNPDSYGTEEATISTDMSSNTYMSSLEVDQNSSTKEAETEAPPIKWNTPAGMRSNQEEYISNQPAYVIVKIRDAECYSAYTQSSFTLYLGALDYHNQWLSEVHIRSNSFIYDKYTSTRTYKVNENIIQIETI